MKKSTLMRTALILTIFVLFLCDNYSAYSDAQIVVDCTDTGSGNEDCDFTLNCEKTEKGFLICKKVDNECYWIDENDIKHDGVHDRIRGDVYGIWGDVSGIRGDVFGIRGDVSGIRGDVSSILGDVSGIMGDVSSIWGDVSGIRGDMSGIRGDVFGIRGDVDKCELSYEDRQKGVNIYDLVDCPVLNKDEPLRPVWTYKGNGELEQVFNPRKE